VVKFLQFLGFDPHSKKDFYKYVILGVALAISLMVVGYRMYAEQRNMKVELMYDYEDALLLQAYTGQSQDQVFRMLQKAGITTICLPEDTLVGLSKQGKATWIKGENLLNMSRLGQIQSYILLNLIRTADIVPENYYVMVDQASTFSRVKNNLINELGAARAREVGVNIMEIKGEVDGLDQIGLGIDDMIVSNLMLYKFQIIPKVANSQRLDDVSMGLKIEKLKEIPNVYTVICGGTEVLGYGNNMNIVVEKMRNNVLNFGLIEFANQKGEKDLAERLPGQTVGVHMIDLKKLQTLDERRASDRYVTAAVERGMRILYIRPFINDKLSKDLFAYNETFITSISEKLRHRGFTIMPINVVELGINWVLSIIIGVIISFAVAVSLYFFLQPFFKEIPENFLQGTLVLFFVLDILFLKFDYFNQWRSILALMVSVIFPTYAMITQLPKDTHWHEQPRDYKSILMIILKIVTITGLGALLIVGLLSDVFHMLKVFQFRGVKLAFGLPLLIVAFYYFLYPYRVSALKFLVRRFFQSQVTVGYVLSAISVMLFFALYLLRSGNYQMPVLDVEDAFRRVLGYIMIARPRTKEFLIGYPVLVFTLYYLGTIVPYKHKWFFYTLATVAPISLLNTFCHLHAPLWLSLLRSFNGLFLGFLFGIASLSAYRFLSRLWKFVF
jgi:hypothetical protein